MKLKASEAILITTMEHIFYLTGFSGTYGFVVMTNKGITLATDQRYWLRAKAVKKKSVKLFNIQGNWPEKLRENMKSIKTVYYEDEQVTVSGLKRWKKILPKCLWKSSDSAIRKQRLVKSEAELDHLRMAASLGDKVLKKVLPHLKAGVTENHIANLFRQYSNELADGVSFDPIIAFGVNGAMPHHSSGEQKLMKNDAILIDQGVKYKGYMSDMTRCFFIGKGLAPVQEMYELLLKVQQASVNMVRPGVKISDLAAATRAMLGREEKYFTHSLGHGIGLEVHEDPGVSSRSEAILKSGMVITIEPGIYKSGKGGVRIEDTVIVTEDGCEVITKSEKKPFLKR
jgi:Xaa-Pro aminopeptidase